MIEYNVPLKKRAQAPLARHSYLGVVLADRCLEMPSCRSIFLNVRTAVLLGFFSAPNVSGSVRSCVKLPLAVGVVAQTTGHLVAIQNEVHSIS